MSEQKKSPWDLGPATLAVLGDVPQILAEFREDLRQDRRLRVLVLGPEDPNVGPRERQRRVARARQATADWMRSNGYSPTIEPAYQFDARTGRKVNPNGVKRARRLCWIERYEQQGKLTARQAKAAMMLRNAWENTQRTAPAIKKVQVDTSPKPDQSVAIMVDRIGGYHAVARHVSARHWPYIAHVVLENRSIRAMEGCKGSRAFYRYMERLREGLDELAHRAGT
ncbi:hypothetical protein [Vannielia litorea]|uniref:hypothetical protein n=1 Tax=Vannielia litorea TaxID=1217970 RepID=UPI001BCB2AD9|nr:hypothetical protein [Vannielia litorea]MBS8227114.1 hypothetical protein [Vannielia litorea]